MNTGKSSNVKILSPLFLTKPYHCTYVYTNFIKDIIHTYIYSNKLQYCSYKSFQSLEGTPLCNIIRFLEILERNSSNLISKFNWIRGMSKFKREKLYWGMVIYKICRIWRIQFTFGILLVELNNSFEVNIIVSYQIFYEIGIILLTFCWIH